MKIGWTTIQFNSCKVKITLYSNWNLIPRSSRVIKKYLFLRLFLLFLYPYQAQKSSFSSSKQKLLHWTIHATEYKKLRKTINNKIKTSKASHYSNALIQLKGNSLKTWQTINELTSRRINNTTVKDLKLNDTIISISNAFNDHFSTIGSRLANEVYTSN